MKHLGNFVRTIINRKNIKQVDIAAAVGIRPQALSRLLNERSWDMAKYVEIAESIGINPADFFKEECEQAEENQEEVKTADCNMTNNEVNNVTNLFGTIGKITAGAEHDTSLLKTMISLQAATIESKDSIIREKDIIIGEKERLIKILMEGRNNPASS